MSGHYSVATDRLLDRISESLVHQNEILKKQTAALNRIAQALEDASISTAAKVRMIG
jgi:uncharacterized coiled-coil protein SlyX